MSTLPIASSLFTLIVCPLCVLLHFFQFYEIVKLPVLNVVKKCVVYASNKISR